MARYIRHDLAVAVTLCVALALGACTGPTVAAPTPVPTATATPTPSCATLLPGAPAAVAPAGFAGLTFPAGTVMTTPMSAYGGPGQFTVQQADLCYHGTPDQVNGPFSGHTSSYAMLFGTGWGVSTTFPADGQMQTSCTGPGCFRSGNPPDVEYYLSFESIATPIAGYVTYHLRMATPPAAPTCNPTYYDSSVPYTYTFQGFAMPPLTKENDFALGGGHMGGYTFGLCSAGPPATILAFMKTAAMAAGDTPIHVTATGFSVCVAATGGYYRTFDFAVGSGNEWSLNRSVPVYTTASC
jgi:hypothetical protein